MNAFLLNLQPWLDAAAKGAAILGVVGLWLGFRQYKHSVKLASTNERRAAIELAARECGHYGCNLMPSLEALRGEIEKSGCEYFKHCKLIQEPQQLRLDPTQVTNEDRESIRKYMADIAQKLNSLEAFAIHFASGVADDKIGFVECGRSFTGLFESNFPLYCLFNLQHYYQSSQSLYWRWKRQMQHEELERKYAQAGKDFFVLTETLIREKGNSRLQLAIASWLRKKAEQLSKPRS